MNLNFPARSSERAVVPIKGRSESFTQLLLVLNYAELCEIRVAQWYDSATESAVRVGLTLLKGDRLYRTRRVHFDLEPNVCNEPRSAERRLDVELGSTIKLAVCGDGYVDNNEECDHGKELNLGAYGGCEEDCQLAPHCGDGNVQGDEVCDPARAGDAECPTDCGLISVCGDAKRTADEACDHGTRLNDGEYGGCTQNCERAAFCGDGMVQREAGERCDPGGSPFAPGEGCDTACQITADLGDDE